MPEGEGVADVEDESRDAEDREEEVIHETMFTFEAFEMVCDTRSLRTPVADTDNTAGNQKFAHAEIARTLLAYLGRYTEFDSPELMKRVVNLIYRQVVRVKAEGLYFNVGLFAIRDESVW